MACDPELADTARFCEAYGIPPEDSANTIVVVGKSDPPRYAACVVLATTRLDVNRTVRKRFGIRKASFASAEETRELTGMLIGGVTAFGLPDDLPIWVDPAVLERPSVVLGGGSRSWKVRIAPEQLRKLATMEVVEGLATPVDRRSRAASVAALSALADDSLAAQLGAVGLVDAALGEHLVGVLAEQRRSLLDPSRRRGQLHRQAGGPERPDLRVRQLDQEIAGEDLRIGEHLVEAQHRAAGTPASLIRSTQSATCAVARTASIAAVSSSRCASRRAASAKRSSR